MTTFYQQKINKLQLEKKILQKELKNDRKKTQTHNKNIERRIKIRQCKKEYENKGYIENLEEKLKEIEIEKDELMTIIHNLIYYPTFDNY
jgi:hypothetical protein